MSKVIKALPDRELGHIVQTEELNVINWSDVYVEHYKDYSKMEKRHNYLIEHLEEVLK